MPKKVKNENAGSFLVLREAAEKLLTAKNGGQQDNYAEKDMDWLLHELQVQQIELEMQNEHLRSANEDLEMQRAKFSGLYDLAPVGYFILDMWGVITEVNNTGCALLGLNKNQLTGQNFQKFITHEPDGLFTGFLESIQIQGTRQSCSLKMLRRDQSFYCQVEGFVPAYTKVENMRCYIAVMDVTDEKKARATQQKLLLNATIKAQENERRRISEALHNSVGQLLYGIKLKIGQQKENKLFDDLNKLLDRAIQETRNISFELAPSILKDFGLGVTLSEMAERLSTEQLLVRVFVNLNERPGLSLEADMFRMIQELVNNSIRHAAASIITISVKKINHLVIEVSDNGVGFRNKKDQQSTGSGLAAIRNRLTLYDGEITIETAPGNGSLVRLILRETEKPGLQT